MAAPDCDVVAAQGECYICNMTNRSINGLLTIDPASGIPIHSQVEEQVRQAVARGSLPAGGRLPTVRALASAIGVHPNTVARAYSALARDGVLVARPGRGTFVARASGDGATDAEREARLGPIMARALVEAASLGFSPEQVEASFSLRMASFRQQISTGAGRTRPRAKTRSGLIMIGSHDLALDILAGHMRRLPGPLMNCTFAGSLAGLIAVARGEADLAGCHLLDEESGEYNLPFVKRVLAGVLLVVVTLAGRSQGLLVANGNPKRIRVLDDLLRDDVTFVNRQQGSGTRVLLDFLLRQAGMDPRLVSGYDFEVETHMATAAAVASGQADVGLGILAAAKVPALDFVPVREERYDLVVPRSEWQGPRLKSLRSVLESREFRGSVLELGGYDTTSTGQVVKELPD